MATHKAKGQTSRVSVTLDRTDHEFLERLATDQERSVSWVAARAIHLFVSEARKGSGPVPGFDSPKGR
jgi:hypothetical protein